MSDVPDLPDFELIAGHVCALGEQQKCRQVIRILQTAPILSPTFPNIGLNKIQNTSNTITKTNTSNGVLHLFHRDWKVTFMWNFEELLCVLVPSEGIFRECQNYATTLWKARSKGKLCYQHPALAENKNRAEITSKSHSDEVSANVDLAKIHGWGGGWNTHLQNGP